MVFCTSLIRQITGTVSVQSCMWLIDFFQKQISKILIFLFIFRVRSVTSSIPAETDEREYEVYSPETQELYVFNRFGQHVATKNILTGEVSYAFTYSVNTSSGKLSTITDTAGNKVFLLRDYSSQVGVLLKVKILSTHQLFISLLNLLMICVKIFQVNSIENTKGQKCRLRMSRMKMLSEITTPDNYNITFDYHGDTGLLRSKLDSAGRSFVYHYDDFGRLTGAVTPTGKAINLEFDLSIKGATVKATYDEKQSISMTVRGSSVIIKTGMRSSTCYTCSSLKICRLY